jgi:1-acyl-sn-glycerol-3-phosphate acyltransferase
MLCRIVCVALFGVRVRGQQRFPRQGGVLLVSNHQSHLDPVLAGISCGRRMSSLARDTLFRIPVMGKFITWLDAIPLDRAGVGLAGVKETLRRLKRGDVVLVFPEGTRTFDGRLAPLKPARGLGLGRSTFNTAGRSHPRKLLLWMTGSWWPKSVHGSKLASARPTPVVDELSGNCQHSLLSAAAAERPRRETAGRAARWGGFRWAKRPPVRGS